MWRRGEQHGDLAWRADLTRRDEGELVKQALRVLHDADHAPGHSAALVPDVPDLQVEGGCHLAGHGHLARTGGIVPADQGKHWLAERSMRVLGAQVVAVDRAGDGDGLV